MKEEINITVLADFDRHGHQYKQVTILYRATTETQLLQRNEEKPRVPWAPTSQQRHAPPSRGCKAVGPKKDVEGKPREKEPGENW
jgi:hypothetical protein